MKSNQTKKFKYFGKKCLWTNCNVFLFQKMSMSNMKDLKAPVIFRWFFKPNLDLGNIFLRLKMKDVPNNGCLNWKKQVTRLWERNWSICKSFYVRKPAVIHLEVIKSFVKLRFLDRNSVKITVFAEIPWNQLSTFYKHWFLVKSEWQ